jgi:hypothetical protein
MISVNPTSMLVQSRSFEKKCLRKEWNTTDNTLNMLILFSKVRVFAKKNMFLNKRSNSIDPYYKIRVLVVKVYY